MLFHFNSRHFVSDNKNCNVYATKEESRLNFARHGKITCSLGASLNWMEYYTNLFQQMTKRKKNHSDLWENEVDAIYSA